MRAILQTPTSNLDESLSFYSKLNFQYYSIDETHFVSDGSIIIEINPDRYARAEVKLYDSTWMDTAKKLEKITDIIEVNDGFKLNDPSGALIHLVETEDLYEFDLPDKSSSILGNFAGLSLESIAIKRSLEIWKILGFGNIQGDINQGWISLSNEENFGVSLMIPNMCPHLFIIPSLTYFNGKVNNPIVIDKIREFGIPIVEEITVFNEENIVDNVIIRDPGGIGFFIFND